jgi:hypothetical protein
MCLTGDRELYTDPEEGDSELGHLDGLEPPVGISQAGEDSKPNPEQRLETQGSPRPADEKVEKMETSMLSKLCSSCLRCIRATVCQKGLDAVAEIVDRADLESAVDIFS